MTLSHSQALHSRPLSTAPPSPQSHIHSLLGTFALATPKPRPTGRTEGMADTITCCTYSPPGGPRGDPKPPVPSSSGQTLHSPQCPAPPHTHRQVPRASAPKEPGPAWVRLCPGSVLGGRVMASCPHTAPALTTTSVWSLPVGGWSMVAPQLSSRPPGALESAWGWVCRPPTALSFQVLLSMALGAAGEVGSGPGPRGGTG